MKKLLLSLTLLGTFAAFHACSEQAMPQNPGLSGDVPPNAVPGKCYAKCISPDGSPKAWQEVLCGEKVTENVVRQIQTNLDKAGYSTPIDGVMGAQTKAALTHYQQDSKLPIGNLDIKTLQALDIKTEP